MGRRIRPEQRASPAGGGTSAVQAPCARGKGACVGSRDWACDGASGAAGGSSVLVNAAAERGAHTETCGPHEEAADGLLGTSRSAPVGVEREAGQSQGPVEGSPRGPCGLGVHWGVLGRTGGPHRWARAEEVPSRLGG